MERLGMWASVLCAIHCMATPLLLIGAPAIGSAFTDVPMLEAGLLGFSVLTAAWVLGQDYWKLHRNVWPLLIAVVGIGLLISGHDHDGEPLHSVAMGAGGLLMALAFWRNYQLRKHAHSCSLH